MVFIEKRERKKDKTIFHTVDSHNLWQHCDRVDSRSVINNNYIQHDKVHVIVM